MTVTKSENKTEMDYSPTVRKRMKQKSPLINGKRTSIGADLLHLDVDKTISSDPVENTRRRTLKLSKIDNSWGFTLQTYGIKHKKRNEIEVMTYVDYVELGGAAWFAGMRRGDVILSVNGERVGEATHKQLVNKIKRAGDSLRLVVLFEDCCKKVELHERFIKLKMVLKDKISQLKELELQEMKLLDDYCISKGLNRFDLIRQSITSASSSNSDSWDTYSMVSSPNLLPPTHKHISQFSSLCSLKSFSMGDNSSVLESYSMGENSSALEDSYNDGYHEDSLDYIDTESDSDGISINVSSRRREPDSHSESDVGAILKHSIGYSDKDKNRSVPNIVIHGDDDVFVETSKDIDKTDPHIPKSVGRFSNLVGGKMPYEELRNSTPDIVTFHAEDRQIVYINDKDESTKL